MRAMLVLPLTLAAVVNLAQATAQSREQVNGVRGVQLGMNDEEARAAMRKIFDSAPLTRFTVEGVPYVALSGDGADFEMKYSMVVVFSPRNDLVLGICYKETYTTYSARDPETIEKALTAKFGPASTRNQSGLRTWHKTDAGAPATHGCDSFATDRLSSPANDCYFYFRREGTAECPIEAETTLESSGQVTQWQLKMWHHHIRATDLRSYLEQRERHRKTPPRL